ncbi:MAG: hypothetical protein KGY49_00715 [Wenzhouxiangellaceae bacterium]|nr:hypothetical protein [Wenzhouxiangellaceae bacterium]
MSTTNSLHGPLQDAFRRISGLMTETIDALAFRKLDDPVNDCPPVAESIRPQSRVRLNALLDVAMPDPKTRYNLLNKIDFRPSRFSSSQFRQEAPKTVKLWIFHGRERTAQ